MRISDEMVDRFEHVHGNALRRSVSKQEATRTAIEAALVAGGFTEEERAAFDGDIPPFATSVTIPIRVRLVGPWEPKT